MNISLLSAAHLYLGPVEDSLLVRFTENNEIFIENFGGLVFRSCRNSLERGNIVCATRDNCEHPRSGQKFQVNADGSISPTEAKHLALGFPEMGRHLSFKFDSGLLNNQFQDQIQHHI